MHKKFEVNPTKIKGAGRRTQKLHLNDLEMIWLYDSNC